MNLDDRTRTGLVGGTAALVALSALGVVGFVGIDPNALCLLPALVLAVPLLMRRYPGERVLAGMSGERRSRWPRPRASAPRLGRVLTVAPHGGQLIARSLAVRPPPALFPAS
jgi:hypothetical protein